MTTGTSKSGGEGSVPILLVPSLVRRDDKSVPKIDMAGSLSEIEKRLILERLNEKGWNVVLAAKSLGITRYGMYSKMKRYNISNPNK